MEQTKFTVAAFSDEAASSLDGQIAAMKRNGLHHIELRNVDGVSCADLTTKAALNIKKQLDAEGLCVKTIGSPIGKVKISSDFDKELDRFLHITEIAEIFGADKIRIFSFYRDENWEECRAQATALEHLNKFAERAGNLILCHENEKGIYGDGYEFCLTIAQNIPKIRAIFDPANFIQCGIDTKDAWKELKDHIEYLHLKDALSNGIVVPCGSGIGNVSYIVQDFLANGGRFMTVEPHLAHFASKKNLESEKYKTCGYAYENSNEAFDVAITTVKKLLAAFGEIAL